MHLLPAYWTTTNHKKRKKKKKLTPSMEKSLIAHEKFLAHSGGLLPSRDIKDYEWRVQTKRVVKEYNGKAVIGQAYNKGNLVVLSSTEAKDDATGKRR